MAIVKLGDYIFTSSEMPDFIPFGGTQSLAVHQLVGGQRVVDAMGTLEPDISWSGTFMGTLMFQKARFIDQMMREAQPLTFTYNQFRYMVLIKHYDPQYRDPYVDYSITLQVIQNLTKPVFFLPQVTWVQALLEQLQLLKILANLIQNGTILDKIGALAAFINNIPDLNFINQSQISSILSLIGSAGQSVNDAINLENSNIFG